MWSPDFGAGVSLDRQICAIAFSSYVNKEIFVQDGTLRIKEVKTGPLEQNDLLSKDSFIVDNGGYGIWVWVGKKASQTERTEAMRNAQGFIKKKGKIPLLQSSVDSDCCQAVSHWSTVNKILSLNPSGR